MPQFIQIYQTSINRNTVTADSQLVTVALYAPGEPLDPNDGAALQIVDDDPQDGLIGSREFGDAVGGTAYGLNKADDDSIFDGDRGNGTGTLYSSSPYTSGEDLSTKLGDMENNFSPVDPDDIAACYTPGTRILTPQGERLIEDLAVGDLVRTRDHGDLPILWIGARSVMAKNRMCPIEIAAGALGHGLPLETLRVSPQHRILLRHRAAEAIIGTEEVFIAAKLLLDLKGVRQLPPGPVTYIHFALDQHAVVTANGSTSESLYLGPYIRDALPEAQRAELKALFPELFDAGGAPDAARPILTQGQSRGLNGTPESILPKG